MNEYNESEASVNPLNAASKNDWSLLHEADQEDNWWCWRKDTGVTTEMNSKTVFFFGWTPAMVA